MMSRECGTIPFSDKARDNFDSIFRKKEKRTVKFGYNLEDLASALRRMAKLGLDYKARKMNTQEIRVEEPGKN